MRFVPQKNKSWHRLPGRKKKPSKRNKEDQRKNGETPEKLRNELAEHKKEMEEENQTIAKKKAT